MQNEADLCDGTGDADNFIVTDKDPSVDIRNSKTIFSVWKNGQKIVK